MAIECDKPGVVFLFCQRKEQMFQINGGKEVRHLGRRKVADMKEIAAFWTSMMNDEEVSTSERFKASELLAKYALSTKQEQPKEAVDLRWFKDSAEEQG